MKKQHFDDLAPSDGDDDLADAKNVEQSTEREGDGGFAEEGEEVKEPYKPGGYSPVKKNGKPRKPHTSQAEKKRIFESILKLMRKGYPTHLLNPLLQNTYGYGSARASQILSECKQLLVDETKKPKEEHIADSYNTYKSIIERKAMHNPADPNSEPPPADRDVLLAQASIDKLLGLAVPVPVGVNINGKIQVDHQLQIDELRQKSIADDVARELLLQLSERMSGLNMEPQQIEYQEKQDDPVPNPDNPAP